MHATNGRMRNNPITKKPFLKRKDDSNKHFDLIPKINKIIIGYLWKGSGAKPIARETLFLTRDKRRSRNIGVADPRTSTKNKISNAVRKKRQQ